MQRLPAGPFCQACAETILEATRPGKADLQAAASDKPLLESLPALRVRRRGAPRLHAKGSVEVATRHAATWREKVEATDAQKLRRAYGSGALLRAGITVHSVTDLAGVGREVVYCCPQGVGVDHPQEGQALTALGRGRAAPPVRWLR